jgi:hypothetical protein
MRFLVCSGTDRAAGESFNTWETVLAVSLTRSATARSVAGRLSLRLGFHLARFIVLPNRGWNLDLTAPGALIGRDENSTRIISQASRKERANATNLTKIG